MTISEANSDKDPVRRHVEEAAKLADAIANAEFEEAMQDPDGFVSVELVTRYLAVVAHQEELKLKASRDLTRRGLRFTAIQADLLTKSSSDVISRTPELLGHVASLHTNLLDRAANN